MAGMIAPEDVMLSTYLGMRSIFEFTNTDGAYRRTNCGQAASATLLAHFGRIIKPELNPNRIMRRIERLFPPDQIGGLFGTGRRRVERICRSFGVGLREIRGEPTLRAHLQEEHPVIVMLQMPGRKLWDRIPLPNGHWMVAYGFDAEYVYLTNHGRMAWADFRTGWNALVPRLICMNRRGLVCRDALT